MRHSNIIVNYYPNNPKGERSQCCWDGCFSKNIDPASGRIWTKKLPAAKGRGNCYHMDCWDKCHGEIDLNTCDSSYYVVHSGLDKAEPESESLESLDPETPVPSPTKPNETVEHEAFAALSRALLGPLSTQLGGLANVEDKINQAILDSRKAFEIELEKAKAAYSEDKIRELISLNVPRRVEVVDVARETITDIGLAHELFDDLLKLACLRDHKGCRINIWVAGPSGAGKTEAGEQVSRAMRIKFYFTGAIAEPYSLLGFRDANGVYQRTQFREAYEHGGMFLFDEIDSSEAIAVMPFNAALSNGHCAFPDAVVSRHPDCVILAAANTWGHGANTDYVGRNKLDGAFINRFVPLAWHIDEKLESALAANPAWVSRVRQVRAKVAAKGIKVLITMRASIRGSRLLAAGFSQDRVEQMELRGGMTNEQWESVR